MQFIKICVDKLALLGKPMNDEDLIEKILDELDCEYKSIIDTVEALRSNDPCSCQVDARFQPRLSSGSVFLAKDVRTGCPDTPSDGFVSHGSRD